MGRAQAPSAWATHWKQSTFSLGGFGEGDRSEGRGDSWQVFTLHKQSAGSRGADSAVYIKVCPPEGMAWLPP